MSLPSVTKGTSALRIDPKQLEAMDGPLIALAEMSGGDLRKLLYAFFSFLNRRTDFYVVPSKEDMEAGLPTKMGFPEGDAEKLLIASFRQFPLRRAPPSRKSYDGARPSAPSASSNEHAESKLPVEVPSSAPTRITKSNKADQPDVRYTDDGKQIPEGNGGCTKRYRWTQTLEEASVLIGVPKGTKGKDLSVTIKPSSISVRLNRPSGGKETPQVLVEGDLVDKVRTDESIWSLEGGVLVITLDKLKRTWWETIIVGDEIIDTSLVDSKRKIDTYDESTQAAIRRILFDQRQERLGLPKSNEILGDEPSIPPLPSGVEYIDKSTLDEHEKRKNPG